MSLMNSLIDWTWLRKKISDLEDTSIETFQHCKANRKKTEEKAGGGWGCRKSKNSGTINDVKCL